MKSRYPGYLWRKREDSVGIISREYPNGNKPSEGLHKDKFIRNTIRYNWLAWSEKCLFKLKTMQVQVKKKIYKLIKLHCVD